jgi:hypothetical protein
MPQVALESKIPASERPTTFHTLDRAVAVIGQLKDYQLLRRDSATRLVNQLVVNNKIQH